jgi:hypothetical protein
VIVEIHAVVDRIEGEYAVIEVAGHSVDWPRSALPEGTVEGSALLVVLSTVPGNLAEGQARLERLQKRGPKGDIIDL